MGAAMKLAIVGIVACASGAAAQALSATLTIEALRAGAEAHWGSIQTIRVSYHSSMPGPVINNIVRDHQGVVTLKGGQGLLRPHLRRQSGLRRAEREPNLRVRRGARDGVRRDQRRRLAPGRTERHREPTRRTRLLYAVHAPLGGRQPRV